MSEIYKNRMTADVDGDFVVFLIGMRINKLWKIHKWLPISLAMSKMMEELYRQPEIGLLSHESWIGRTTIMIQYWRSFEHLEKYAMDKDSDHLIAWRDFNLQIAKSGDVGIWHETYFSKKGQYEAVYNNMPKFGLAKTGKHISATGHLSSASGRVKNTST